jgi:hypothetical protein
VISSAFPPLPIAKTLSQEVLLRLAKKFGEKGEIRGRAFLADVFENLSAKLVYL